MNSNPYNMIIMCNAGEPDHIDVLVSIRAEFVYDVALPVLLQRPVKLNISYVDQSRQSSSPGRLTTTEYNDTRSILYREVDTGQLPFERYFVRISIVAEFGNRRVEGASFTSSELIGKLKTQMKLSLPSEHFSASDYMYHNLFG